MPTVLWDASGLAKRYTEESGKETVNGVFARVSGQEMVVTPWGYAESYSILLKKYNGGVLSANTFNAAYAKLQAEVLGAPGFNLLTVTGATIFGSLSLMQTHNINSADAALG